MPGHADDTVTVYLGGGRTHAGHVGSGVGLNAYPLRTTEQPWFATGAKLTQLDATEIVACTQVHHSMEGRDLVRVATFDEFAKNPRATQEQHLEEQRDKYLRADEPLSFYPDVDLTAAEQQWGMSIDLTSCIGCNACIAACQAENNIPVVGKEQVAFGREMHWLRVDRYLEGPAESPTSFHFQPLPCMHCENAPCEYVCPVEATVHSADGLNDMIYNRCVGTRFCSNNCPYKVRRFNYLAYSNFEPDQRNLQYNPDVTVRSRGVMEKCTYCVQRIRQAQIDAENEQRPIRDGEILTACQAVCPTEAIVFGDLKNRDSELNRRRASPLHYGLLEELNTKPRTTYLAELRNPNPQMEAEA
jgi:molybdopterin-containing oxidoreductase family iron-sulfur binding subunit